MVLALAFRIGFTEVVVGRPLLGDVVLDRLVGFLNHVPVIGVNIVGDLSWISHLTL